jgi:hypothetical protein
MNECAKASRTKNILSNQSPGRQSPVAAGEITFKGYGRGAAAMTPLDAARLLIAVTGSTFAKDAMTVLANFAKLTSLKARARQTTLESFLANASRRCRENVTSPQLTGTTHAHSGAQPVRLRLPSN